MPLATLAWNNEAHRLEWTIVDRARGSAPREDSPNAEEMNREILRLHASAWRQEPGLPLTPS